jgi:hypothetical protein
VVHESSFVIDLDNGQPLTVAGLELGIARDVDLDELEAELVARLQEDVTRPVAQAATGRVEQRDPDVRDTNRGSWSPRQRA